MGIADLPAVNACLNSASAVLLLLGYAFIRARRIAAHKACMLGAFATSAAFLTLYLVYHFAVGHVVFPGRGWIRGAYLALLASHVLLAIGVLPFILRTLWLAWRERFDQHARLARWVFPVWVYVSVTGIVVYAMLYRVSW